ncbi:protein kinase [Gemmatimonadota bacterium]
MIGKTVGHYQILEKIGSGGMGDVWLANDTRLERKVALKFLPAEATSEEDQRRFIREARAASVLDHPNICTIHEIDNSDSGQTYIAMAYCDGETVKERIARGPLKIEDALEIAIQTGEGLARAHKVGIVHRDIKPANVIITEDGLAKIVDFGLAKLLGSSQLTRTGSSLGTVAYMSPEQVRGDEVDHRADIWSLGVMLYELVTGQLPFQGDNETTVMYSVLNAHYENPGTIRQDIPHDLEETICKALVKDPDNRYQHIAEMIGDLQKVSAGGAEQQESRNSIAVLPFTNMSADPENEYFSDGITEDIITQFTRIRDLKVVSRTSIMQYKDTDKSIKEIGRELGVATVLEGSVRKAGNQVRIVAQLIDAKSDDHLWAETFNRELEDIFAVQSEVAEQIAAALDINIHAEEQKALQQQPTENLEAYQAYMRGRYYMGLPLYTEENWSKGMAALEQAVELDPTFALAWAELSTNHAGLIFYMTDPSPERLEMARSAAERATQLAPDDPEIHLSLGIYNLFAFRDTETAGKHLRIAEKGLPGNARIPDTWGLVYQVQGRWEASIEAFESALKLNPNDGAIYSELNFGYWFLRKYQQAVEAGDRGILLAPGEQWAYLFKIYALWGWRGRDSLEDARITLEAVPGGDHWIQLTWYWQLTAEGNYQEAIDYLEENLDEWLTTKMYVMPKAFMRSTSFALMGQKDMASSELERARELLELEVEKRPNDHRYHSTLGIVLAGLGQREEAIKEGQLGMELLPLSKDGCYGITPIQDLAHIYSLLGEYDAALDQLEYLMSIPSWIDPRWMELMPWIDPLRDHPRYMELVKKYK